MPSNYASFDVRKRNTDGTSTPLIGVTVKVYDSTNNEELDALETDENGIIAAGELDVDAGTRIQFRIENYNGLAGSITQITTA